MTTLEEADPMTSRKWDDGVGQNAAGADLLRLGTPVCPSERSERGLPATSHPTPFHLRQSRECPSISFSVSD